MSGPKLTPNADKVLRFLYDNKKNPPKQSEIAKGTRLDISHVKRALIELKECGFCGGPPSLLEVVRDALKNLDKDLTETSDGYTAAVVLMASYFDDADEEVLASELGYEEEFVKMIGSRLRNSGVWEGNKLAPHHRKEWEKENGGAICFFLDCGVAEGKMLCSHSPKNGEPSYSITEGGLRDVKRILQNPKE